MEQTSTDLETLLLKVEHRERQARKWAIIYSLVPIALAAVLLGSTAYVIAGARSELIRTQQDLGRTQQDLDQAQQDLDQAQQNLGHVERKYAGAAEKLEQLQSQVAGYEKQVQDLNEQIRRYEEMLAEKSQRLEKTQEQLTQAEAQLRKSTSFVKHVYPITWEDVKASGVGPEEARILEFIGKVREQVRWNPEGGSLEEGFNSPAFAAYVLRELEGFDTGGRDIRAALGEIEKEDLEVGDLVLYDAGYTMFYFRDNRHGKDFVVGMTPFGVASVEMDFGPKITGYRDVEY